MHRRPGRMIRRTAPLVLIATVMIHATGCRRSPVTETPVTESPVAESPQPDASRVESPVVEPEIRYIDSDPQRGTSAAVVVAGHALAHTAQILPLDNQGQLVGEGSVEQQLGQVLSHLEAVLASVESGLDQLVKLDFYVDGSDTASAVQGLLAQQLAGSVQPAVTWAATPLPHPGALLALDAVAAVPGAGPDKTTRRHGDDLAGEPEAAHVAVLPRGGAVYLSGHPERGEMAPATEKAMAVLIDMLNQMGLDRDDVVHVKAFLDPMDKADVVRQEIARAFAGQTIPPVTLVHWISPAPIEIEIIASAPPDKSPEETVRYFTPAGVKPSPRFSRAAQVHGGKTIYLSGLHAQQPGSGEEQVRDIFDTLQSVLQHAGSDLQHLVKATYYCADEDSSRALDELRGEYFDPERPPAASKVMVTDLAIPDRSISIDMIAVTPP